MVLASVNTSKEIRAEITLPGLHFAGITGAGDFTLAGEQQDRLDIYVTGVGDVQAFQMPVNTCNIRISGTGNCRVHANEALDVIISGTGEIPPLIPILAGWGTCIPTGINMSQSHFQ